MENATTAQLKVGTWEKLPTENVDKKPRITFGINETHEVVFVSNDPKEFQSDNGAYYLFDVEENKEAKVIMTSAWSLLRTLKTLGPLAGKVISITKKIDKGKQYFEVLPTK